ncbi:hypothetical protein [Paludisphaera soli]|uniref:hypothetical protein n=1 Tax=Paludisphaera soli TaxID=2712865 RepID=UPI0013EBEF23|nr:hypothetical protein [Paludisphaera soli]
MDHAQTIEAMAATTIAEPTAPRTELPDATWDEGRLLAYMREHDRAVEGLERKSLRHEYYFGAAAQLKYDQLGGKWTRWAKDQGYPKETFRRRRLLFFRAGSVEALDKYVGKMEAYYDLGIYPRPKFEDLLALDAAMDAAPTVAPTAAPVVSAPEDGVVEPPLAAEMTPPAPSMVVAAIRPSSGGSSREPVQERPTAAVLRGLEDRYADAVEALPVRLPQTCWKLLDFLAAQEEAGHDQVIARAVREYWLRNGDPARLVPAPSAGEVSA